MNLYERMVRWAGTKRWFAYFGRYVLTPIDKRLANRTHTLTTLGTHFPLGYLTTVGHRSGELRTVPLLYVETTAGVAAVVGTNWGEANHPAWATNLEATPEASWRVEEDIPVRARPAARRERVTIWEQFVAVWPAYEQYLARSGRDPKIFVLEPRALGD